MGGGKDMSAEKEKAKKAFEEAERADREGDEQAGKFLKENLVKTKTNLQAEETKTAKLSGDLDTQKKLTEKVKEDGSKALSDAKSHYEQELSDHTQMANENYEKLQEQAEEQHEKDTAALKAQKETQEASTKAQMDEWAAKYQSAEENY